jgi:hypothetical protein
MEQHENSGHGTVVVIVEATSHITIIEGAERQTFNGPSVTVEHSVDVKDNGQTPDGLEILEAVFPADVGVSLSGVYREDARQYYVELVEQSPNGHLHPAEIIEWLAMIDGRPDQPARPHIELSED